MEAAALTAVATTTVVMAAVTKTAAAASTDRAAVTAAAEVAVYCHGKRTNPLTAAALATGRLEQLPVTAALQRLRLYCQAGLPAALICDVAGIALLLLGQHSSRISSSSLRCIRRLESLLCKSYLSQVSVPLPES